MAAAVAPLVINFLTPALGSVGASIVGNLLVSVAASAIQRVVQSQQDRPPPAGIRTTVEMQGESTSRTLIFGRYATKGAPPSPHMSAGHSGDTPNAFLTKVIELSDLPVAGLDEIWLEGEKLTLGPPTPAGALYVDHLPVTEGRFAGRIWFRFHDGNQTTADMGNLEHAGGAAGGRPWQADMIGRGIAHVICRYKFDDKVFRGDPQPLFVVRGIGFYDPRKDSSVGGSGPHRWGQRATYESSENAAVQIYNVLRGIDMLDGTTWGGDAEAEDLPLAVWFAAMNECDVTVDGAPQYRSSDEVLVGPEAFGGVTPAETIEGILRACAGSIAESGGVWRMRVGPPAMPVLHLTDDDFLITEEQTFEPFEGLEATFNGVSAQYPEPEEQWAAKEAPIRIDETMVAQDGNRRRVASLLLNTVTHEGQVQRLMQGYLRDGRRMRRHSGVLPSDFDALEALDAIWWTSARNGYTSKVFEVDRAASGLRRVEPRVVLRERDSADYSWSPRDKLPSAPVSPQAPYPEIQQVPGWNVAATTIADADGAPRRAALILSWSSDLVDVRGVEFQIRVQGRSELAVSGSTQQVEQGAIIVSEGVLPATVMEARGRLVASRPTSWSAWMAAQTPDVRLGPDDLDPISIFQLDQSVIGAIDAAAGSAAGDVAAAEAARDAAQAAASNAQTAETLASNAAADASGALTAAQGAAGAAGTARDQAQQAQAAASGAQTAAEAARDTAAGHVTDAQGAAAAALQSAQDASGFASSAEQQAQTAIDKALEAVNAAGAAAGHASTATSKASEAGDSASAAAGSATAAETAAGQASASEGRAATSEQNAAGSENRAEQFSKVAAVSVAQTFPAPIGDGQAWAGGNWTSPENQPPLSESSGFTLTPQGTVIISGTETANRYLWQRGASPDRAGRITRITAEIRAVGGVPRADRVAALYGRRNETFGGGVTNAFSSVTPTTADTWETISVEHGPIGNTGSVWARWGLLIRAYEDDSTDIEIRSIKIEDVTSEKAAEGSAEAAATSASTAETKATEASQSASAASGSATEAATSAQGASDSAGSASTHAGQASQSASDAAGSASQAATSAGAAADSANAAGQQATAASDSAQTASTKATEAGQSAAAAATAKTAAETAAGSASTYAGQASQSATDAAGSVSAAAQHAGAAADSATTAGQKATAASDSAQVATTKATEAGQSATAADTSRTQAASSAGAAADSATLAGQKADAASGFAGDASTSATQASQSASDAAGSASSASNSATAAAGSATTAGDKATAASDSAQTAATKASEAGQSAQAAATAKTAAETAQGKAETAQTNAASSETNAAGSATAASQSATVTAEVFGKAVQLIGNPTFDFGFVGWWNSKNDPSPPAGFTIEPGPGVNGRNVLQSPDSGTFSTFTSAAHPAYDPTRTYRLFVRVRNIGVSANTVWWRIQQEKADGSANGFKQPDGYVELPSGSPWQEFESFWGAGEGATPLDAGTAAIYLHGRCNTGPGNGQFQFDELRWEDVTDRYQAAASASAAAQSASDASASESEAGQHAQAALGHATNAEGHAGSASTFAGQASQYKNDAAGSASQAATSEGAAADSATAAGQHATAASESAQTAATKADEAGQSASASQTARTGAETAKADAETAQSQAATAKTGAENAAAASESSRIAARASASFALPAAIADGEMFTDLATGGPDSVRPLSQGSGMTVSGGRVSIPGSTGSRSVYTRGSLPYVAGKRYRVTAEIMAPTALPAANRVRARINRLGQNWDLSSVVNFGSFVPAQTGQWQTFVAEWTATALADRTQARGGVFIDTNAPDIEIRSILFEDITSEFKAAGSASAAATSAQTASTKADDAVQSASAASSSAVTAETHAGTAGQKATQAGDHAAAANVSKIAAADAASAADASSAQAYEASQVAARLMSGGVSMNPTFREWDGGTPNGYRTYGIAGGAINKTTAAWQNKYGQAVELVSGASPTQNGPILRLSSADYSNYASQNPQAVYVTAELFRSKGNARGTMVRAVWSGDNTVAVAYKCFDKLVWRNNTLVQFVAERPAGFVPGSSPQFYVEVIGTSDVDGAREDNVIVVHRLDYQEVTLDASVVEWQRAKVSVEKIASAAYGLRVKAGGVSGELELVALDDPVSGPVSAFRIAADLILLNGSVKADHLSTGTLITQSGQIGSLTVDTLHLKNGSLVTGVTSTFSLSTTGTTTKSVVVPAYSNQSRLVVLVSGNDTSTGGTNTSSYKLEVTCNGVTQAVFSYEEYPGMAHYQGGTFTIKPTPFFASAPHFNAAAGNNTVTLKISTIGSGNVFGSAAGTITVLEMKKAA